MPYFLTKAEVARIIELKHAGNTWKVVARKTGRKLKTIKMRYQREMIKKMKLADVWTPRGILSHREVWTTAGTYAYTKYKVVWEGSEESSWESFMDVRNWEVYVAYNLSLQHLALRGDDSVRVMS